VQWINIANTMIFKPVNLKVTLFLFENSFRHEGSEIIQRRRSIPFDTNYMKQFPSTYSKLASFMRSKIYRKKSEIKFGLVVNYYD